MLQDFAYQPGQGKTFCPSEAARALASDWRSLMEDVRRVAGDLQRKGALVATQRGAIVAVETARGPIRLGLNPDAESLLERPGDQQPD